MQGAPPPGTYAKKVHVKKIKQSNWSKPLETKGYSIRGVPPGGIEAGSPPLPFAFFWKLRAYSQRTKQAFTFGGI